MHAVNITDLFMDNTCYKTLYGKKFTIQYRHTDAFSIDILFPPKLFEQDYIVTKCYIHAKSFVWLEHMISLFKQDCKTF